jgi:hypothetical protein
MNIFDETVEIGKSILTKQHKFFPNFELDDLSHISEMKLVIEGISEYLSSKDHSENDIERTTKILIQFAEKNFLEQCAKAATDVGNTPDEEADKEYFAYIYNTGKYPE